MKKTILSILFIAVTIVSSTAQSSWVRVNQVGYLIGDVKVAVWVSKDAQSPSSFDVVNVETGETVYRGNNVKNTREIWAFTSSARLYFSEFKTPGRYLIQVGDIQSVPFNIGNDVYADASEIPLKYMRQQRCGYNPFLKDSCHVYDAISVGDPDGKRDGQYFNTTGGWHDASDYLQYVATSANAVYQMLFAYTQHPESFDDNYDANGDEGANGIPDILDEAKWGLDWLVKMNPDSNTYFNQLADDRDHIGFTLPNEQKVDYGWGAGKQRPVYFVSPKPQGLQKYKNRSTGMASTLGKYTSSFSLGAKVLSKYYPEFLECCFEGQGRLPERVANPGVSQTAPARLTSTKKTIGSTICNWLLLKCTTFGQKEYLTQAINYGRLEPVTLGWELIPHVTTSGIRS